MSLWLTITDPMVVYKASQFGETLGAFKVGLIPSLLGSLNGHLFAFYSQMGNK
jgi:hypothetical protein